MAMMRGMLVRLPVLESPVDCDDATVKEKKSSWSLEEGRKFFNELLKHGKQFDFISAKLGTKDREQVRHYYYRCLKNVKMLMKGANMDLEEENLVPKVLHGLMKNYAIQLAESKARSAQRKRVKGVGAWATAQVGERVPEAEAGRAKGSFTGSSSLASLYFIHS